MGSSVVNRMSGSGPREGLAKGRNLISSLLRLRMIIGEVIMKELRQPDSSDSESLRPYDIQLLWNMIFNKERERLTFEGRHMKGSH